MHAQDTTGRVLRQLIDCTPQTGNVEVALMESYDQEVGLLLAQEFNDCFHLPPFNQKTLEFDAVTFDLGSYLLLKFCIKPAAGRLRGFGRILGSAASA